MDTLTHPAEIVKVADHLSRHHDSAGFDLDAYPGPGWQDADDTTDHALPIGTTPEEDAEALGQALAEGCEQAEAPGHFSGDQISSFYRGYYGRLRRFARNGIITKPGSTASPGPRTTRPMTRSSGPGATAGIRRSRSEWGRHQGPGRASQTRSHAMAEIEKAGDDPETWRVFDETKQAIGTIVRISEEVIGTWAFGIYDCHVETESGSSFCGRRHGLDRATETVSSVHKAMAKFADVMANAKRPG